MAKDFIQIADLIGTQGAGKKVTAKLPIGGRVFRVCLKAKNTAAANTTAPVIGIFAQIDVEYNGETIWSLTGTQLDVIQTKDNAALASQAYTGGSNGQGERHLTLYFAQPTEDGNNGLPVSDRDLGAIPTNLLKAGKELRVSVTFCDTSVISGVTPALEVWAEIDDVAISSFQPIRKIETHEFAVNAATKQIVNEFPDTGRISELHFFDTDDSKTVERVELTIDRKKRWDLSKNDNTTSLKGRLMNPAAGCYHVVFAGAGLQDSEFFGGKNVVTDVTFSAAASGTLTVVSQRFELPNAA